MDINERRRKLKQAYELLSLSTEIIQDVLNARGIGAHDEVDGLQVLCNELDMCAADLSRYALPGSTV